jgi:hypothetical protein
MPPMRSAKAREMILETRPETVYLPGGKFGETIPFTLTTGDCKGNRCQRGLRNCRPGCLIPYDLVKRFWDGLPEEPIVPWTPFRPSPSRSTVKPGPVSPWIAAVDCAGNRIAVLIDGIQSHQRYRRYF